MSPVRVDLGFTPHAHQREAHELRNAHRFNVLVWHRRAGKTVFAVMELVLSALRCERSGGRFGYIAPFLGQAKEVAWDYLLRFTEKIPGRKANISELSVTLPNGARIRLYGADNPDAIRGGYFDGVVMDEVADMRPQVWGEIVRPMLSDRLGWALFIGTPKGVNLFSELYYAAVSGDDAEWHGDLRPASATGVIPEDELESARKSMGASQFAQEYECDFGASVDNVLIPVEAARSAMQRDIEASAFNFAPKVLGIDVARYGDDRSVFAPRQGLMAYRPKIFRGLDTMTLADQAARFIDQWGPDATFVDVGAMGAGVYDRLIQLGYNVTSVDFGSRALEPRFQNRRAEMWWHLADWIKSGGCLPNMPDLLVDLTAPTYTHKDAAGRMKLESKDDLRKRGLKSPDIADAYALTFAAPVPIRTEFERVQAKFSQRRMAERVRTGTTTYDYDPLALGVA